MGSALTKASLSDRALRLGGLVILCSCALLVTGCERASTANVVVTKAQSPDGKSVALLIDRYYRAPLVSDGFFLIVIPNSQNADMAISAPHIDDSAALVATWASKVKLHWLSNETLLVICNSCGLKPIDIVKKTDHVGSTKILYQGFPKHTAYK